MKIEVLGPGCDRCEQLFANVEKAIESAGITAELRKVKDIKEIASYGVAVTPALVIDGKIRSIGKLLTVEEIAKLIA
jgi:small redox-active disulfide protein 2